MTCSHFPRGTSSGSFLRSGRLHSVVGPRTWALEISDSRVRSWHLQVALDAMKHPFRPCSVTLDGNRLPRGVWRLRHGGSVFTAHFHVDRGARLVVSAAGC